MKCDHIVAEIAGVLVKDSEFDAAYAKYRAKVEEFTTSRKAIPHPGFVTAHAYCINCGAPIDGNTFRRIYDD